MKTKKTRPESIELTHLDVDLLSNLQERLSSLLGPVLRDAGSPRLVGGDDPHLLRRRSRGDDGGGDPGGSRSSPPASNVSLFNNSLDLTNRLPVPRAPSDLRNSSNGRQSLLRSPGLNRGDDDDDLLGRGGDGGSGVRHVVYGKLVCVLNAV